MVMADRVMTVNIGFTTFVESKRPPKPVSKITKSVRLYLAKYKNAHAVIISIFAGGSEFGFFKLKDKRPDLIKERRPFFI